MASIERELVLVAMTASSGTTASMLERTRAFSSGSSGTASTASSTSRPPSMPTMTENRVSASSTSALARPKPSTTLPRAATASSSVDSARTTSAPASRNTWAMPAPIVPPPTTSAFMSTPNELRWALVDEGTHALDPVRRSEEHRDGLPLVGDGAAEWQGPAIVDEALGGSQGERRPIGKGGGNSHRTRPRLSRRDHLVHQPEPECIGGAHGLTRHEHVLHHGSRHE